jgi:biopolymer transport protein ExbB/TolQ
MVKNTMTKNKTSLAVNELPEIDRSHLNRKTAGAGAFGTGISILFLFLSIFFLLTESHIPMMLAAAMGLMTYSAGSQTWIIFADTWQLLFSSKHINERSTQVLVLLDSIRKELRLRFLDETLPLSEIVFPETSSQLADYVTTFLAGNKVHWEIESIEEFLRVHFYEDAAENYEYSATCLEFVGNLMPLVGIAGTLHGMLQVLSSMKGGIDTTVVTAGLGMAMNATLYGALFAVVFKVLASRFRQQHDALLYDFEELIKTIRLLKELGHRK